MLTLSVLLEVSAQEAAIELSKPDRAALQTLEEDLWREETRFDPRRMNEVIAEDYFEFGRSGRLYSRGDILGFPRVVIDCVLPLG